MSNKNCIPKDASSEFKINNKKSKIVNWCNTARYTNNINMENV